MAPRPVMPNQYREFSQVATRAAQPNREHSQVATRAAQPRIRAQAPESAATRFTPLQMPSPAELGLGARDKPVEVDWADVRHRLQRLEVTSFHLQKLADGGFRFTCVVPTSGGTRKVDAEAIAEADAIDRALTRAEKLK